MCALSLPRRHALVDSIGIGMEWLHGAASFMAEVKGAFVAPLWLTLDTAIKPGGFALRRHWLEAA